MAGSIFDPKRTLEERRQAAVNLFDFLVRGGMADTRRMPSEVIDDGPQCTLHRYEPANGGEPSGLPVLLVPPLGAPATCMDLRRGCSLAEHLITQGRPTYLVDYGAIGFSDKRLGLEHWIRDVVPTAIRKVSDDRAGEQVQLVGWCMGGIFSLISVAAFPGLPVNAVAMVASPFDFTSVSLGDPLRQIYRLTGGNVVGTAIRALGGAPARIVGAGFKATALTTYLKKPITLMRHRDDREFLAHIEAVDGLMDNMYAYPGRAMGQAYHRLFHKNELATGTIAGPTRMVELADVRVPVMNVAGCNDVLAPLSAVHHVGDLLPNA
ncbi:MAG TPA: alpha/beta hydrolase, partial [Solirubrobacteraceae bacterium]|nr:alpha/beta hydrolase [Solirubrobacteraceae bacterium]